MEIIKQYFPDFSEEQFKRFEQLYPLYLDWNSKINLISRKDIESLYLHHVLHSLAILKYVSFKPGAKILDLGTGGGFPGIPLAIACPEVNFLLVDSIGKKINVVIDIASQTGLTNVRALHSRAEDVKESFDFVITRAVARLNLLKQWSFRKISEKQQHAIPNGLIALKGPTWAEERKELPKSDYVESFPIRKWFRDEYFEEKYLVYLQR